jgi:predicted RNA-binding Zn-ribbon protein involved in translation (DUF1610 family)
MSYLTYETFREEIITCKKCEWKGLGSELQIEEFHESSFIIDYYCPKCGEHIGFTQPPMSSPKKS